jgi:tripartite-type tricarboxylate transporter receptor subunit TctC
MTPLLSSKILRRPRIFFPAKFGFVILALGIFANTAQSQTAVDYPSKPITFVVGYPPGGSTDLTARTLAEAMAKRLGVAIVVENLGGAGGTLGAQKVVNANPDGYTLLLGANNEVAINKLINPALKYDAPKDLTPVGLVASQPLLVVAAPKTGVKTTAELIDLLKKNPGKFSYGSSGVGTSLHLAGEMLKEKSTTFMVHIPYRGVAPLASDLIGNNLEFGVFVLSSGLPHVRSGKLIAIGTTELKRSAITPDIPALAEHPSLSGMDIGSWFMLLGPKNLAAPILVKLQKALAESLQDPALRKKLQDSGSTIASGNIDLNRYLADEIAKYRKVVEFAKIRE